MKMAELIQKARYIRQEMSQTLVNLEYNLSVAPEDEEALTGYMEMVKQNLDRLDELLEAIESLEPGQLELFQ